MEKRMYTLRKTVCALLCVFFLTIFATWAPAQEKDGSANKAASPEKPAQQEQAKQQGPPPAIVVTATAKSGLIQPQYEYIGSVYFPELSEVAAEISGRVDDYTFEEGRPVKKGQPLIKLNTELEKKDLETAKSEYRNIYSSLENARRDLERIKALYQKKTVSEQDYDKAFYLVAGLENRATALEAKVQRLEIELKRADTRAPFDGVVLQRLVDRGEWLNPGTTVALIARNDVVDVQVNVPQEVLAFLHEGQTLPIIIGEQRFEGEVFAIIPQGDVATRTFPVKVRIDNPGNLAQGMEARVRVPTGSETESVLVPRDAVLMARGINSLWAIFNDLAVNIPVEVTAYQGMEAAVRSLVEETPLKPGMQVVIKGNERLRPGQKVVVVGNEQGSGQSGKQTAQSSQALQDQTTRKQ